jgi:hypothetical protein
LRRFNTRGDERKRVNTCVENRFRGASLENTADVLESVF